MAVTISQLEAPHLIKNGALQHCLKLKGLLEQLQKGYRQKHKKLEHNIGTLYNKIFAEIKKDTGHYGLIQLRQEETIAPIIFPSLTAEGALLNLMQILQKQFKEQLPEDTNSHIFTPRYHEKPGGFESELFSHGNKARANSICFFNPARVNTTQLQKELNMIGIHSKIDVINNTVRITFNCIDPTIFNIAAALQQIHYEYSPQFIQQTQTLQNSGPGFRLP